MINIMKNSLDYAQITVLDMVFVTPILEFALVIINGTLLEIVALKPLQFV